MKSLIKLAIPIALIALLLATVNCGDDDNDPAGPNNNTSFRIVASVNGVDTTLSGSVTFTVTNNATVTGVFREIIPTAANHNLTGNFIDITNVLAASGAGYNFSGIMNDTTGQFQGVVTGAVNCLVIGARDEDNSSVAYCGTYSGDDSGTWNFVIEGNALYGSHTSPDGDGEILTGTITGNVITLFQDGDQVGTGIRDGDNVSGTWNDGQNSGTWTGSRCN